MPAERLAMRRVREILRYRFEEGLGHKAISYKSGLRPRLCAKRFAGRTLPNWPGR